MSGYLKNILQLVISPQEGWKDLGADYAHGRLVPRELYRHSFLPLLGLCAASALLRGFYDSSLGFLGALQLAVIWFVAFFLAYHVATYALALTLHYFMEEDSPQGPAPATKIDLAQRHRIAILTMYCMGIFALMVMLGNVIKVELVLIQVLPLYLAYILWKGSRFLGVTANNAMLFVVVASVLVVVNVYLIYLLFYAIL